MIEKAKLFLDSPQSWLVKIVGFFAVPALIYLLWTGALGLAGAKAVWFMSVIGLALLVFAYFAALKAWNYALLSLSLFVGGGAQLWLTQPLWIPALRLGSWDRVDMVMVMLVALQALLALSILLKHKGLSRISTLVGELGLLRILLFIVVSGAFSLSILGALPRSYGTTFILHLIAGGAIIGVNLLTLTALLGQPSPFSSNRGFHPLIPAAIAFVASALLAWFAFERLPHVEDELVYLFQARSFASGMLSVPAPPDAARAALEYYLLDIDNGRWFATTAPGWPAALSLGVLAGAPWLVNPILAALAVLLAHGVATRISNRRKADIVVLLMCTSPWFLGASASLMPHTLTITLTLFAWWLLLLDGKTKRKRLGYALLAGLAMGWVFTTRQVDGLLIGTLTGVWLLWRWKRPDGVVRTLSYGLGAIATGGIYLIHNAVMTGNMLLSPLARYIAQNWPEGANSYGFGPEIGPPEGWSSLDFSPGHSPTEGLLNTAQNLSALQLELFGWGVGSLALIYALFLWGRLTRADLAMLAIAGSVMLALFFYWFSGNFYIGPRYWFALLFPALFLSASGFDALSARLKNIGVSGETAAITLVIISLFGLGVFTTWRGTVKYLHYGNYTAEIQTLNERGVFSNALVFFKTDADPGSALVLNDPNFPADKPIFMRDLGEKSNAAISADFPQRRVISYSGQ